MSFDENKSNSESVQEQEDSPQGFPAESGDQESWLADLIDVRVIMFLVSVVVVAMTATVLIFSRDNPKQANGDQLLDETVSKATPSSGGTRDRDSTNEADASSTDVVTAVFAKPLVEQANDGSFVLPISSAVMDGCENDSAMISDWQTGGTARWQLNVHDRRSGFFYCHVTYQAKFKSQFAVQFGDRSPLKFTVYPNASDFTEQFIVRLDSPEEPSFRLLALKVETVSGVRVKQIRLVPRK